MKSCIESRNTACKKGPGVTTKTDEKTITGHRTFYPCGLGAKMKFFDSYAVYDSANELIKMDQSAEKIAYSNDYKNKFRNLDPEGIFCSVRSVTFAL